MKTKLLLALIAFARLATAQTNPIDVANAIEQLRIDNAALEDQLDPKAALLLLRQENAALKVRINGLQSLAEVKASMQQLLMAPTFRQNLSYGISATTSEYLRALADPNDPQHAAYIKKLAMTGPVIIGVIDATTAKLASLPPTTNQAEATARKVFAAKLAAARQASAEGASSPKQANAEWNYAFRDLLAALP